MKLVKNCKNCLKSKPLPLSDHYLCSLKGIVTADYVCNQHRWILPTLLNVKSFRCIDCKNFHPTEVNREGTLGTCRLFTERAYNGSLRKACSRIVLRKTDQISS